MVIKKSEHTADYCADHFWNESEASCTKHYEIGHFFWENINSPKAFLVVSWLDLNS